MKYVGKWTIFFLHLYVSWPLTHSFCFVLCTVLPVHPALTGHPHVHPRPFLAFHRSSASLLRPQLHHGGARPLLQPSHQTGKEPGVAGQQRFPPGPAEVRRLITCHHLHGCSDVFKIILDCRAVGQFMLPLKSCSSKRMEHFGWGEGGKIVKYVSERGQKI